MAVRMLITYWIMSLVKGYMQDKDPSDYKY